MEEFGATFPEFKTVLIDERNMYLTNSLRAAFQPIPNEFVSGGKDILKQNQIEILLTSHLIIRFCSSKSCWCSRTWASGGNQT